MPFDSEGNFTRKHNWEDDRINGIEIVTDHHDEEDDNFAQGLNDAFLRDGRVPMAGILNMGGFRIQNCAAAVAETDVPNRKQMTQQITQSGSSLANELWVIGDIKASVQTSNHGSWLLCNGQAVSRTTYADLFALIGTKFGVGNGSTTFNVPDYRGKFLRGLGGDSAENIQTTQPESIPFIDHRHYSVVSNSGVNTTVNPETSIGRKSEGAGDFDYVLYYKSEEPTGGRTSFAKEVSATKRGDHVTPINQAVNFFIKAKNV